MKITEARCTSCGASLELNKHERIIKCQYCQTTVVTEYAVEFANISEQEASQVRRLRENLKGATLKNNITEIDRTSSLIKDMIPSDFSANYYYGYAKEQLGDASSLYAFYDNTLEGSPDEVESIINHITKYSELRDKQKISLFIDRYNKNKLHEYLDEFEARKDRLDYYDSSIKRDVFICHRSTDLELVEKLVEKIEKDGYECWVSYRNLRPNDSRNYWLSIEEAIDNCGLFLSIASESAMLSKDVQAELKYSVKTNKKRIQFKVDEVNNTRLFKESFDGLQWVDGTTHRSEEKLLDRIHKELSSKKAKVKTPKNRNNLFVALGVVFTFVIVGYLIFNGQTASNNVVDIDDPVINIIGDEEIFLEIGQPFNDPGVLVEDDIDESVQAITVGTVDSSKFGTYTITYYATDDAGNQAETVTRTVIVQDNTSPIITIIGQSEVTVEVNEFYTDLGATVTDNYDNNLNVVESGSVNSNIIGIYTIIYSSMDSFGNEALDVVRTINVVDSISPTISINGGESLTININDTYIEYGVNINDNYDNSLDLVVFGSVDTSIEGTYTITYQTKDNSGNESEVLTRTIEVIDFIARDHEAPVITLEGGNYIEVEIGTVYEETGANIIDNYSQNLDVVTSGSVDVDVLGTYTITYNVTDQAGNEAIEVIRTIVVQDTTAPTLSLDGETSMKISVGSVFTDPGFLAEDNYDLNDDLTIIVTGEVDELIEGIYTITYQVTDSEGNVSIEVTRTVEVKNYVNDYTWLLKGDSTYEVTGYIGTDSEVAIPGLVDGTIVTSIGESAFEDSLITSIELPSSIITIGNYAFMNANNLSHITIPEGVIDIGISSFLTTSLTQINLPSTLENIGLEAFGHMVNCTDIIVDENNLNFTSIDGVLFSKDGNTLFAYPSGKNDTSYSIPEGTVTIGANAIGSNSNLTEVIFPTSLTTIKSEAFINSNLLQILIPDTVIIIEGRAFAYNNDLFIDVETTSKPDGWVTNWNSHDTVNGYVPVTWGILIPTDISYFTYEESFNDISITGYSNLGPKDIVIPSIINDKNVVKIDYEAFKAMGITSVVLPETLTLLRPGAFADNLLESIVIPASVTQMHYGAFRNNLITSVEIQSTVVDLSVSPFVGNDVIYLNGIATNGFIYPTNTDGTLDYSYLASYAGSENIIVIPDTVIEIGDGAFEHTYFDKVTIPNSVTIIGETAFRGCNLSEVTMPESVSIGKNAFDNNNIMFVNGVFHTGIFYADSIITGTHIVSYGGNSTNIEIPSNVTSIGFYAFANGNLSTLVIPEGVLSIGESAFTNNPSLTTIEIASSVTMINARAFNYCDNIISVTILGDEFRFNSYWSATGLPEELMPALFSDFTYNLKSDNTYEIVEYVGTGTNLVIPDMIDDYPVTEISANAFDGNTTLTSVVLGQYVTTIGNDAFSNMTALEYLEFPNATQNIGEYALYNSDALEIIVVSSEADYELKYLFGDNVYFTPSTLSKVVFATGATFINNTIFETDMNGVSLELASDWTTISSELFNYNISSDLSIIIPESVTNIEQNALHMARTIVNITVAENNQHYSSVDGVLFDKEKTILIKYPARNPRTTYSIPDSVVSMEYRAFFDAKYLTTVIIPEGFTSIGNSVFESADALTTINIPDSIISIGNQAFYRTSLHNISIPASVISIGNSALLSIDELESITVAAENENYSSIDGVLYDKRQIVLIKYPEGKLDISFTIPDSVKVIGSQSFGYLQFLANLIISESVTDIEEYAFTEAHSLTDITVAAENAEFSSIDGVLFDKRMDVLLSYPANKSDVTYSLPDSVMIIGTDAFANSSLEEIIFGQDSNLIVLEYRAFYNISLTSIIIPNSVTSVAESVFHSYNPDFHIYVEALDKPSGWADNWYSGSFTIIWGYTGE